MRRGGRLPLTAVAAALLALAPGSAFARTARPPALTPGQSTAALGLDLLRRLPPGNLVFSPDSIETAVAMAGTGAAGPTATQIAHVLHLPSPSAFGSIGRLQAKIAAEQAAAAHGDAEAPQLRLADALFLQQGFPAAAPFVSSLKGDFAAPPLAVDFENHPEATVMQINEWVSQNTQGLIPSIVSEVSRETRLLLANAVYLHAYWAKPFEAEEVYRDSFHGPGATAHVPFMHHTERLPYSAGPGYQAVALPYRSSTLSLMLVLPSGRSLAVLEHGLSAAGLSRIAVRMKPQEVRLALPKFHLKLLTQLGPAMASLGMPLAFTEAADFSRIDPAQRLRISRIVHAADIEVQEAGTVAAAATIIEIEATAVQVPPATIPFIANRPFLYFLRDTRTGAVLFAGRLVDAAAAQG